MEPTILTKDQRQAIAVVSKNEAVAAAFYLTGGTALAAYYLHHRYSDDLDFFTAGESFPQLAVETVAKHIKDAIGGTDIEYRRIHDRRVFFIEKDPVELKIEFTSYPFPLLHTLTSTDGIRVDSLEDIAANKIMALMDRIDAKDFFDLYFLVTQKGFTFSQLLDLVKKKFGFTIDPVALGSEFAKVRTLTALPRIIAPLKLSQIKDFFSDQAELLRGNIIVE